MKNLVLIAPPAAGKGTLSNLLSKEYNIPHISTGDLLRKRANVDDEFGIELLCLLQTGELVDDNIVLDLVKKRLSESDCEGGYILDGYPRNLNQANELNNILNEINLPIDYVIYLDINKNIAKERMMGRITCPKCGAIYNRHDKSKLPKIEGICDECGSRLNVRMDDSIQVFERRFEEFTNLTLPVVNFYESTGKLVKVDGTIDTDKILVQISNILKGDL